MGSATSEPQKRELKARRGAYPTQRIDGGTGRHLRLRLTI